jgi:zinc protease
VTSSLASKQNRQVHRTLLPNGITVLVTPNPAADIVSARMFLQAGSRYDPRPQAGLANLMAAVLTKGSQRFSSLEIAEQVESIGASLGTDAAADYFLTSIKAVATDFPKMLALAAEVMRFPTFPENEVEVERRLTLQSIKSQQEQPFNVVMEHLRHGMYGSHPYSMSGLGTDDTVQALTRDDLVAYHTQYFRPDRLTISIAGRVDADRALAQVTQAFGDWAQPTTPLLTPPMEAVETQPHHIITAQPNQQSIVMLGYLAPALPIPAHHPDAQAVQDYAALKLLNSYLGNGLSSRLFVELREKRGLAYEVSAFYPTRLDRSQFVVYMGTAPENTQTAYDGLKSEVDRLVQTRLEPEELQTAKNKLLGQYALGKQTNSQLAQTFGWYESVGLGVAFDEQFPDQIRAIGSEAIQAAASRCFGQPYVSVLGPEAVVNALELG